MRLLCLTLGGRPFMINIDEIVVISYNMSTDNIPGKTRIWLGQSSSYDQAGISCDQTVDEIRKLLESYPEAKIYG